MAFEGNDGPLRIVEIFFFTKDGEVSSVKLVALVTAIVAFFAAST